jgi:NAD-dependent dihydropyrimidine dehydrogenase PreA subunit
MNIYILTSGKYGSRIVNHIAKSFSSSIVGIHEVPEDLPEFIEDVTGYMPDNLPEADLVIAVGLNGDINLLAPLVAEGTGAKSIIISVHEPKGMPPGLMQEINDSAIGKVVVFAKPFCILTPMGDAFIDEFATKLGKPVMEIEYDDLVKSVTVIRDAPCGCTSFIAEELVGTPVEEAEYVGDIKFHNYPCQASMSLDRGLNDTILHVAGYLSKEAVRRALGFSMKSAVVDLETCNAEGEECDHLCVESCPQVKVGVDTVLIGEDNKAVIDPGSCGCCEQCLDECPYGSIEIVKQRFDLKKKEV